VPIVYFEDLEIGSVHFGRECVCDKDEMLEFSRRNDPWPFHVDEAAAAVSPYGGIVASGGYIVTLWYRSLVEIYNTPRTTWAFLGGLDWKLKFRAPVRAAPSFRPCAVFCIGRPSEPSRHRVPAARNGRVMDGSVAGHAASHWDGRYSAAPPRARDWLELPYVREQYINPAVTGASDVDWFAYVAMRYIAPARRVLEVGCGSHGVSFELCRRGFAHRAVAVDVSPEAIRISRDRHAQLHVAQMLIKSTTAICAAVGAQPIPLADMPILTSLQVLMVSGIMYISGRERSLRAATEFIAALGANVGVGMLLREGARAMLKFFPGWGNVVCGMVAGAGTYAMGRAATAYFLEGASLKEARQTYLKSRRKRSRRALPSHE